MDRSLKYSGAQNDNLKNLFKLLAILAGMAFLFWLWLHRLEMHKELEAPQGEPVSIEDVHILLQAINLEIDLDAEEDSQPQEEQPVLTYAQYKYIYEQIAGAEKNIPDFAGKYEDGHAFLKEDWYQAYQLMLAYFDRESTIWKTTVFILKVDAQEKKLYTQNSEYIYCSSSFSDSVFTKEEVYVRENELLTSIRVLDEKTILENVWVMEVTEGTGGYELACFYHQIDFNAMLPQAIEREQVADLIFENGRLADAQEKKDKIRGKLLSVSKDALEIEGYGTYETEESMEIYKLCGTLEAQKKADLMIGYDYTDFVVKDNKICAALVSREGELDQIRVLLKNTSDGSYFYEKALVKVDGQETLVEADKMQTGERLSFRCAALTDKVKMEIEGINKEDDTYRGMLEFYKTDEGMVIINELPLEEYLYAVVPSEMPASYPMEALKAQAVCARTYAFRYILHAGLAQYGAHLDDTTSYQVYHNIAEQAATTTAVKETDGMMLYYGDELADNYYYSTSCGYGTDTRIWKSESDEAVPYIRAGKLAPAEAAESAYSAEDMMQEDIFTDFISGVDEADFESSEPWYRWSYEVKELDTDLLLTRIQARYQANASFILTRAGSGGSYYYVSEKIDDIGEIKEIEITRRGVGGIADEMIITGSKKVIKIISEYNIRYILCDGKSRIIRQDGSITVPRTLLPSAFFIIETGNAGEDVVGYRLTGGGYGHGVGMSQNGAKEMGSLGYSYQDILKSFFTDCAVRERHGY
ncbi:MAG: SpoIID/LytB domain-containing protein [Roseburia sp.]|nr:SpoIID/LytB domain-containing protein [Roseburia sp.]MCM1241806.1 SpoIID/LytB domain-containing protein [Roseburia sp.]